MSFPISPSNNQIALVNGIEYYYHATKGAWYRYGDGSANVITSNTFQVLSSIIFSDGTSQTSAASPTDSYARTTANTNSNNITIIQGVDVGQNTRMTIIEGVDATQNTNITAADAKAQAAFDKANTSITTSGGSITGSLNVSQDLAVTGNVSANYFKGNVIATTLDGNGSIVTDIFESQYSYVYQNLQVSGDITACTNLYLDGVGNVKDKILELEEINSTQNTNISITANTAQAAFDKANDAYTLANTANAAAGSGGASLTSFTATVDSFTGNGSQTEFTLSAVPDSEDNTFVFLNGVYQEKGTYSIAGANVVLTGVATSNDTIEVTTVAGSIMNVSPTAYSTRIYQGNGSTNTFTISVGHTANTVMVFNNGVCQFPGDDYTVSGTTLTYVLTPQSDETIQIREMPIDKLVPLTQPVMRRYTANGAQTLFTVTAGQTANSMFVYENGICQVPVSDYTVSGVTLTFVTAPVANVVVQIREMSI